ncbi:hypothetical protein SAMN05421812_117168 [Asanoa hainanensis]|uniref:Uncharacterized protein n=1 Tax=Asanoa hainanensis TaxID=560556 RepID=A0A239PCI3_9ACTN|nr:hypothetical protein [Asanoa hainanensis]SNT64655.1 hypothetical protein SAMN05421812_117168 [Asanoa hainanensis]
MSADIFVDGTGRRRRVLTWVSVTAAALLVGALGLLAAGLFTGAPLPLRGWTDGPTGPDSAVIGPAPTPAPPASRPTTQPGTDGARTTSTPTAPANATAAPAATTDRPGRGNGRGNRPTAKPSHPQPKAD